MVPEIQIYFCKLLETMENILATLKRNTTEISFYGREFLRKFMLTILEVFNRTYQRDIKYCFLFYKMHPPPTGKNIDLLYTCI